MRKYLSAFATIVLLGSAAQADPVNAKNVHRMSIPCGGVTYDIATIGNAGPGHIVGSTSNLIPLSFSGYAVDAMGNPVPGMSFEDTVGNGKRTGQQDWLIGCSASFTDPETGMTFILNVTVFKTPRGK